MGQLFSYLRRWLFPETRKESQRYHDHQTNYKTFYDGDDDDVKQHESHFIKVLDDHQPIISDLSTGILGILDNNYLDSSADGVHIAVVDLIRGNEEDAEEKDEEPIIKLDYGKNNNNIDQILEKYVTTEVVKVRTLGPYTSAQRLLLVGEGDFSFSASLVVAFGTSPHIVATSLNSQEFLKKNYGNFINNKAELQSRGSMVLHHVDATKMAKHHVIGSMVFDRIIFNFPHVGKFGHSDTELSAHQKLIREFLRNAKKMIGQDGEIHITSKCNGFFLKWNIPKIGRDHSLNLIEEINFSRSKYPGYCTKYGFGGDKDFDCNPSKTYVFGLSSKLIKESHKYHDHQTNSKSFYDVGGDDVKQHESHFIKVVDDHQPIISDSSTRILGILDNNYLDSSADEVHIAMVDLIGGNEEDAKEEKHEEPIIKLDYGKNNNNFDQILEKYVATEVGKVRTLGQYTSAQRLLLVGEGDFSFSASLAVAFGTSPHIVATSLNSQGYLMKNYPNFINNKAELQSRGSMVIHEVDAMEMVKHHVIGSMVFDRIIFNFPHAGGLGHTDTKLRAHQKLIREFLRNAKKMIGEDGEIHITSKPNGFFRKWNIPKIGRDESLNLIEEINFSRSEYPGYCTKYGFRGDKKFNINPCKTYKFGLSPN